MSQRKLILSMQITLDAYVAGPNDKADWLIMADSFVSNVESLKRRDKYNVNHINQLAKIFKCSPRDFLPENPL